MATTGTGERYIDSAAVTVTGTTSPLGPLAITNKSIGGSDFGVPPDYQMGVTDGIGLRTERALPTSQESADSLIYVPMLVKNYPSVPDAPVLSAQPAG